MEKTELAECVFSVVAVVGSQRRPNGCTGIGHQGPMLP